MIRNSSPFATSSFSCMRFPYHWIMGVKDSLFALVRFAEIFVSPLSLFFCSSDTVSFSMGLFRESPFLEYSTTGGIREVSIRVDSHDSLPLKVISPDRGS